MFKLSAVDLSGNSTHKPGEWEAHTSKATYSADQRNMNFHVLTKWCKLVVLETAWDILWVKTVPLFSIKNAVAEQRISSNFSRNECKINPGFFVPACFPTPKPKKKHVFQHVFRENCWKAMFSNPQKPSIPRNPATSPEAFTSRTHGTSTEQGTSQLWCHTIPGGVGLTARYWRVRFHGRLPAFTSWYGKYTHYLQGFIPRWCRISSIWNA